MDDTRLVRDASEKGTANLDLQATSGLVIVDSNGMEMTGAGLTYTNDPATDLNKDKYGYGIKYVEAERKKEERLKKRKGKRIKKRKGKRIKKRKGKNIKKNKRK